MEKSRKIYVTAEEVAEMLGVSTGYAYKIIRGLNEELKAKGYKFLLSMFNHWTEPSVRQQAKINSIIINNIIPYILRLEQ